MKTNSKRLYGYIIKQKKKILLGVLATLIMGLIQLFTGSLLKFLTDLVEKFSGSFVGEKAKEVVLPAKYSLKLPLFNEKVTLINKTLKGSDEVFRGMLGLCLLFLGLYVLLVLANYGRRVFMNAATQRILQNFKADIYKKVLSLPYYFFGKNKTGDIVSRITYDVTTLSEIIDLFIEVARALIFILIFVPVMFSMSWQLSLFTILFFPLSAILIEYVTKHIKKVSKKLTDNVGDYTAFLEEKINGFKLVKGFRREKVEEEAFNNLIESNYQHNLRLIKLKYSMNPTNELLSMIVLSVVFVFYSYRLTKGHASIGDIVFYIYLVKTAYKPIKKVAQAWGQLHIALVSTAKIFRLLDEPEEEYNHSELTNKIESVETLSLKNVSFTYPDSTEPILQNISFEVKKGDRVALVGRSGAGKSTLLNLIPRFYLPDSGSLAINGIDFSSISLDELRSKIAHLDVQTNCLNATIKENIEYGGRVISEKESEEFATFLGLQSKEDLNLIIGKEGVKLSEGQKQKLGFIRAIVSKPKVLILDEAFGSLDQEDINSFMKMSENVDVIFYVSRKPEVLKFSNRAIHLKDGVVEECRENLKF